MLKQQFMSVSYELSRSSFHRHGMQKIMSRQKWCAIDFLWFWVTQNFTQSSNFSSLPPIALCKYASLLRVFFCCINLLRHDKNFNQNSTVFPMHTIEWLILTKKKSESIHKKWFQNHRPLEIPIATVNCVFCPHCHQLKNDLFYLWPKSLRG